MEGHHALEIAVLVHHQRHRRARFLEDLEGAQGGHRIRERRAARPTRPEVERASGQRRGIEVLDLDDADHMLRAALDHGKARIVAVVDLAAVLLLAVGEVEPFDLGARRHHRADATVAEAEHHLHDRRLGRLEMPGGRGLAQHQGDLFLGDGRRLARPDRHEPQHEVAGCAEEPLGRGGQPRHDLQQPGQAGGNVFGPAEGEALWHQFAEDQREIGDENDHHDEADRFGVLADPTGDSLEMLGQRVGKGGAAQDTGEHADHGDADLYG